MKKLIITTSLIALLAAGCNKGPEPTRDTQVPTNDQTQNPQPTQSTVKVAVVALEDNGKLGTKFGCNDSIVFVNKAVPFTTQPLNAAFKELFGLGSTTIKDSAYKSDLYNVIYSMKNLSFDHATIDSNGLAKVFLKGKMGGLGGVCDSPRVQAQIEQTAKQFSTVKSVEAYLNDQKINWQEFSSQK
jgi:hypothetical protein